MTSRSSFVRGRWKKKGVDVTAEVVRVRKESRSVDISDA
jgi:hypothetical protein